MHMASPEWGALGHPSLPAGGVGCRENRWRMHAGSVCCAPTSPRIAPARRSGPAHRHSQGTRFVKVIASSIRKGNIVDMDGKLYVVLTTENIHPGKGTPVTQADMRRMSDG